jgi:predicted DNA-binding transcriptional regulator YafY
LRPCHRPIQKSKSLAVLVLSATAVWLIVDLPIRVVASPGRYRRNRADSARYLCLTLPVVAPTSRLLELLELLQTQPLATGREIADRLGIDRRTVRRYIAALQALDIPVEGQRGVGGGYRIRPGYRLPPLMLTDDEAVVVALGLVAARHLGLDTDAQPVDGAATKIHRVLPDALRRQVEALESTLGFTTPPTTGAPVAGATVLLLADAVRRRRRVRAGYTSFEGAETRRDLSPFGLVVHNGRWYLAAYDHVREDMRTFRIDRMRDARVGDGPAASPPGDFDVVAHVSRSLARVPWRHEVEVLLELPFEKAAARLPPTLAELIDQGEETLLRMRVSSLPWTARVLAGLNCTFTIHGPDELRTSVRALSERLGSCA